MTRREWMGLLGAASLAGAGQTLRLRARSRKGGLVSEHELLWRTGETAIIICDMWDKMYCRNATARLGAIAVEMNRVIGAARQLGVRIIHAPSSTMDVYAGTPQRRRMIEARPATPPVPIASWCYLDRKSEAPLPIVDSDPCDDEVPGEKVRIYTRQNAALDIREPDGISDSGVEMYNFFEQEGIHNLVVMGVHTNMCVLGRSFGIRQMTRLGKKVALARDLTDALYNPKQPPYVTQRRGTELVIEHIERYWCPSVLGSDLTRAEAA